jgi:hypothetical protein
VPGPYALEALRAFQRYCDQLIPIRRFAATEITLNERREAHRCTQRVRGRARTGAGIAEHSGV